LILASVFAPRFFWRLFVREARPVFDSHEVALGLPRLPVSAASAPPARSHFVSTLGLLLPKISSGNAPPGAVCVPDFLSATEPPGFPFCGSPELLVVRRFGFVQSVQTSASRFYRISLPSSNWVLRRLQSEFVDLPPVLPSSPEASFPCAAVRARAFRRISIAECEMTR
jgi:hypothetical protein